MKSRIRTLNTGHYGALMDIEGRCGLVVRVVVRRALSKVVGDRHGLAYVAFVSAVGSAAVVVFSGGKTISGNRSRLPDSAGTHLLTSKDERGDDVGESKGEGDNAGSDDDLRDLRRHLIRMVGAAAKATKEMAADEDHDSAEPSETPVGTEQRPGVRNEGLTPLPDTHLGEDEKTSEGEDEGVDDVGEELEAVGELGEDEHEHRCCHDC